MPRAFASVGLSALAAGMAGGRFLAEHYLRSCLARIAASEAQVQAWAFLDPQYALRQAKRADDRRAAGEALGALAGVPVGVKDIIATVDMPTEMGSPIFAGNQPRHAAECVERLERAGAYVVGKTVTTEFAYLTPAKTRNPWNLAHTPGGSSAGSAAAVAAGHVPAAIGTQTNGSVIRPAAFCGIVGFKPTKDTLPYRGVAYLSPSLDQLGVFARRVADAALLAANLAEAPASLPAHLLPRQTPPLLLSLANLPWVEAEPAMHLAQENTLFLLQQAGARVVRAHLPTELKPAAAVFQRILLFEAAQELGPLQDRERSRISAQMNATLDAGRAISESDYFSAVTERQELSAIFDAFIADADAVLLPPAPGAAPRGLASTGNPAFCTLWSLTGMPALTLPTGLGQDGLPMGLQLGARRGQDANLLAVARWVEERIGFDAEPPI